MAALLVLCPRRTWTGLSTHDTALHTLWYIGIATTYQTTTALLLVAGIAAVVIIIHVTREIHQIIKFRNFCIFILFHITLKFRWNGWFDGNALPFRRSGDYHHVEVVGHH